MALTEQKQKMLALVVVECVLGLILYFFHFQGGARPFWGFSAMEWMGASVLIFLMMICLPLPYDTLVAAAADRRQLAGSLAYLVLWTRIAAMRTAFFAFFVAMAMTFIFFLPLFAATVLAVLLLAAAADCIRGRRTNKPAVVLLFLLLFLLAGVFSLGLLAPAKAVAIAAFFLRGMPAGGQLEALSVGSDWFAIDYLIGVCGIVGVGAWLAFDAFWRFRQARQVENLPTSKIRSLAVGLVEVTGIVRPAIEPPPADKVPVEIQRSFFEYLQPRQRIELFRLEDGTGSVLVDARECRVRAGWLAGIFSVFGVREIVLTKRREHSLLSDDERKWLTYGDRIYLIGNAEEDPLAPATATGPDRLVIKPSIASTWSTATWQGLFGITPPKGKDIHNVFFLSDASEQEARQHILRGFQTVLLFCFLWVAASVGLIWSTTLPERAERNPHSWRNAYWRGPEPDPNPMIIDYSRNHRLFRFEKYLKTVGPTSYREIPALIEAAGYKDYRFYTPAISALLRMLPQAKEQVRPVLPLLIGHLNPCTWNAVSLQTTINAISRFGPDAAPAVPKLMEALQCRKTNTYEVTAEIIRMQAARALGEIGPEAKEAVPLLQEALNDVAPYVRDAVQEALRRITGNPSGSGGEEPAVSEAP